MRPLVALSCKGTWGPQLARWVAIPEGGRLQVGGEQRAKMSPRPWASSPTLLNVCSRCPLPGGPRDSTLINIRAL